MKMIDLPDMTFCRAHGMISAQNQAVAGRPESVASSRPDQPKGIAPSAQIKAVAAPGGECESCITTRFGSAQLALEDRLALVAHCEALAAAIHAVYPGLPPAVQAQCLEISHFLASLRLRKL